MISVFNSEMDQRLSDLWQALTNEEAIEVAPAQPFQHMPAYIRVSFGKRCFALSHDMARMTADQIEANGFPIFASRLRPEV